MRYKSLLYILAVACTFGILACAGNNEPNSTAEEQSSDLVRASSGAKLHDAGDRISIIDDVSVNETGDISLGEAQWVEFHSDGSRVSEERFDGANLYRLACLSPSCRIGNSDALENDGRVLEGTVAVWRISSENALKLEGYATRAFWQEATADLAEKAIDAGLNLFDDRPLYWSIDSENYEAIQALVESGMPVSGDALHAAMDQGAGALKPFELLLGSSGNPDAIQDAHTLLDRAIDSQPEFVPILLSKGASPTATSLELAIANNRTQLINELLERDVPVSPKALSLAVRKGDRSLPLVLDLLTRIDPNRVVNGEHPVLRYAIEGRYEDLVEALIEHGANVDPDYLLIAVDHGDTANHLLSTLLDGLSKVDLPPTDNRLIYSAVRNKDDALLATLLEYGAPVGSQSFDAALNQNNKELLALLLEGGASIPRDSVSRSILLDNQEVLQILLEFGAEIQPGDLGRAIREGNLQAVELLLSHGTPIEAGDLRIAIEKEANSLVEKLLVNGAPVSRGTLNLAIEMEDVELVATLLQAGADLTTSRAQNPLETALQTNAAVVEQLLAHGAKVTPLLLNKSISDSTVDIALLLIKDATTITGESLALAYESGEGNIELMRALLEKGADPDGTITGYTLLYKAATEGKSRIVNLLLEFGTEVNKTNGRNSWTALHGAAFSQNSDLTVGLALLEGGADPRALTSDNLTPCDIAQQFNRYGPSTELLCQ